MSDTKSKQKSITDDWKLFISNLDLRAKWPMLLFLALLTVSMVLNGYAMSYFFVPLIAYSLSGFMEVGTLVWEWASERAANSKGQQQLATALVWLNVGLFVCLLFVNLIRAASRGSAEPIRTGLNGWDIAAFSLIVSSAIGHVVGYLVWRQKDERLIHNRRMAEQDAELQLMERDRAYEERKRDNVLLDVNAKLRMRQVVYDKLNSLRAEYRAKRVPANEIEALLKEAAAALELQFHVDYDGDGQIGQVRQLPEQVDESARLPELPFDPDEIVGTLNQQLQSLKESLTGNLGSGNGSDPTPGSGSNHR